MNVKFENKEINVCSFCLIVKIRLKLIIILFVINNV